MSNEINPDDINPLFLEMSIALVQFERDTNMSPYAVHFEGRALMYAVPKGTPQEWLDGSPVDLSSSAGPVVYVDWLEGLNSLRALLGVEA